MCMSVGVVMYVHPPVATDEIKFVRKFSYAVVFSRNTI